MQEKCKSVIGGECKHVCYYSLCQCEKREGCAGCKSLPVISAQGPQPPFLEQFLGHKAAPSSWSPNPRSFPSLPPLPHYCCAVLLQGGPNLHHRPSYGLRPQAPPGGSSFTSQRYGCPRPMANSPDPGSCPRSSSSTLEQISLSLSEFLFLSPYVGTALPSK